MEDLAINGLLNIYTRNRAKPILKPNVGNTVCTTVVGEQEMRNNNGYLLSGEEVSLLPLQLPGTFYFIQMFVFV